MIGLLRPFTMKISPDFVDSFPGLLSPFTMKTSPGFVNSFLGLLRPFTVKISPGFVQGLILAECVKAYGGVIRKKTTFDTPGSKIDSNQHCTEQDNRQLTGGLVWKRDELTEERFIHTLTPEEIEECEKSMQGFKASHRHWGYISQETFPLPTLGIALREWSRRLHNVDGVLIVRGLMSAHYTDDEFMILQAGISAWIGSKRGVQTGNASKPEERYVALHVTDHDIKEIRKTEPNRFVASANTSASMPFHTDSGDIISLGYRQLSPTGGEVRVASGWTVYNQMLKECPEVIETLMRPFPWHIAKNIPDRAFHGLLHETVGPHGTRQITMMSERRPFFGDEKSPRLESLPKLSSDQVRALEKIQKIAGEVCTLIELEVGDIFFINNRAMLHARSSYVDDPRSKRHAIRIVLRDDDAGYAWPVPEALEDSYRNMFGTRRPEEEIWEVGAFLWGTGPQHG